METMYDGWTFIRKDDSVDISAPGGGIGIVVPLSVLVAYVTGSDRPSIPADRIREIQETHCQSWCGTMAYPGHSPECAVMRQYLEEKT